MNQVTRGAAIGAAGGAAYVVVGRITSKLWAALLALGLTVYALARVMNGGGAGALGGFDGLA